VAAGASLYKNGENLPKRDRASQERSAAELLAEDHEKAVPNQSEDRDGNEDLIDGKFDDLPHGLFVSLAFLALGQVDLTAGGSVRLLGNNFPKAHGEGFVFTAFHSGFP
jgi:hypothetical protein